MRDLHQRPAIAAACRRQTVFLALVAAALTGCDGGTNDRAEVSGTVYVDNRPVETGGITFVPVGEVGGPATGGAIADGRFDIPAERGPLVGKQRIKVIGSRKTGKQVELRGSPGMMVDELVNMVPPRYSSDDSPLIETIKPGQNELELRIPSK